jgi:hypothetical protein
VLKTTATPALTHTAGPLKAPATPIAPPRAAFGFLAWTPHGVGFPSSFGDMHAMGGDAAPQHKSQNHWQRESPFAPSRTRMIASLLLALCFLHTAYGAALSIPPWISSAPQALTNVCAYQTPQSTAKVIVGLTGFTDRPVSPSRPRNYPPKKTTPVRLATTSRLPPRFTDSIVQRNPNLCTDHADPTPNICSAEDKCVLICNEMIHPAGHDKTHLSWRIS